MATLDENFRAHILADSAVAALGPDGMAQNIVPQDVDFPYIWYQRADESPEMDLDGSQGIVTVRYNVETVSNDIDQAVALGIAARKSLFGFKGLMGDSYVGYCMVEDVDDDYQSKQDTDEGEHIYAFVCEIKYAGD